MSKIASFLRRHAAPALALVLVTGGAAAGYGVAASSDRTTDEIHACVNPENHVIHRAHAAHCPDGWHQLAWNVTGPAGADAPTGAVYVYSLGSQAVDYGAKVGFANVGYRDAGAFTLPTPYDVQVSRTGVYSVRLTALTGENKSVTVVRNNVQVAGGTFAGPEGPMSGEVVLSLAAGDVISLISTGYQTLVLGDQWSTVNATTASLIIQRVS